MGSSKRMLLTASSAVRRCGEIDGGDTSMKEPARYSEEAEKEEEEEDSERREQRWSVGERARLCARGATKDKG